MFNLKKSIKKVQQSFKDPQTIVAEIHEAFDTATDKLLKEAKDILAGSFDIEKGKRLKKVGFVMAKKVKESENLIRQKNNSENLAKQIEYYKTFYPNNKFITEQEVKRICQKYGLLFAEAVYYISDVPEKNLLEIESFNLRDEEKNKYKCGYFEYDINGYYRSCTPQKGTYGYVKSDNRSRFGSFISVSDISKNYHFEAEPLKICASAKDFNTEYMRIEDEYKLELNLPDPVVLQPVKDGYLVVTKWGLEAEDKGLINETHN